MFHHTSHQIFAKDSKLFAERKERIFTFLRDHPVGVLSTVTPEQRPHGSVVYFAIGQDKTIAFITKKLTRKYRNLSENARVMLTVFETSTQTTASVVGHVEEVTNHYELNEIAGAIMSASLKTTEAGIPPITKLKAGTFAAFRIVPSNLYMAIYNRPDRGGYEEVFESLESFELEEGNKN